MPRGVQCEYGNCVMIHVRTRTGAVEPRCADDDLALGREGAASSIPRRCSAAQSLLRTRSAVKKQSSEDARERARAECAQTARRRSAPGFAPTQPSPIQAGLSGESDAVME